MQFKLMLFVLVLVAFISFSTSRTTAHLGGGPFFRMTSVETPILYMAISGGIMPDSMIHY